MKWKNWSMQVDNNSWRLVQLNWREDGIVGVWAGWCLSLNRNSESRMLRLIDNASILPFLTGWHLHTPNNWFRTDGDIDIPSCFHILDAAILYIFKNSMTDAVNRRLLKEMRVYWSEERSCEWWYGVTESSTRVTGGWCNESYSSPTSHCNMSSLRMDSATPCATSKRWRWRFQRDEDEDFNCCVIKTGFYELSLNYLVDTYFCCINVVDLCRLLVLW